MLVESKVSQGNMSAVCLQIQDLWTKPQHKVFVFRADGDIGDICSFYQSMTKQLGNIQMCGEDVTLGDRNIQRSSQLWSQVYYDPQFPNAYRHSLNAQPLHSDGSYVEKYDCTFMYCIRNSEVGG
ncbi:MAG: TauD/TfdA family dioxygenase, partial [Psychrosphaera sp.]|nr:TauD/TfdA family dioxygenase [Psychrosphaera sp.]